MRSAEGLAPRSKGFPSGDASNTWTQAAGELDLGPFIQITFTEPGPQSCNEVGTATLFVEIDIDGKLLTDKSYGVARRRRPIEKGERRRNTDTGFAVFTCR